MEDHLRNHPATHGNLTHSTSHPGGHTRAVDAAPRSLLATCEIQVAEGGCSYESPEVGSL